MANPYALANPFGPASGALMPTAIPALPSLSPVPVAPPTQTNVDQQELQRLQSTGSGISQISNPFLRTLASVGGALLHPITGLAQTIPGTNEHHQLLVAQQDQRIAQDQAQQQAAAVLNNTLATTRLTNDKANEAETPAAPETEVLDTDQGKVLHQKGATTTTPLTGAGGAQLADPEKPISPEVAAYKALTDQGIAPLDAFTQLNQAKNTKDATIQQQFLDGYRKAHPGVSDTDAIAATIRATQTEPKITVLNAAAADKAPPTGTWSPMMVPDGKGGMKSVLFNSKTGEVKDSEGLVKPGTGTKISSDEQKRADLAQNMNENINAYEDILSRRPELFGPVAGRLTQARALTGTSDADITRLMALTHQLGMVAQGAHGMRSAQGVESAANSLTGGFHNSPEATKSALEAARTSVATFLSNSQNPGQARTGGPPPGATQIVPGSDGKNHYTDGKKDLGVAP